MTICSSTQEDLDEIFRLYALATERQQSKGCVSWPPFERALIEREIGEGRQWKLLLGHQIACIWATTFDDPLIWKQSNSDAAVYLHRIAANLQFKGRNLVLDIVKWARHYAVDQGKNYIRLDTVGYNVPLIQHYQKCGFQFLGFSKIENAHGLPMHYQGATVSLLEIQLNTTQANGFDPLSPNCRDPLL